MSKELYKRSFLNSSLKETHEPELFETLKYLYKQKKVYYLFLALSFIAGILSYLTTPKLWKGEFQIVMELMNERSILTGLSKFNKALATDITILKSPYTLEPVFNFIKDEKIGQKDLPKDIYSWIDNIKINNLPSTTVINVSYLDQDKELIIPVLDRIKNIYKNYTIKNNQIEADLGLKYLNEQVRIAREKADISLKEFQDFALKEGLGGFDGLQIRQDLTINGNSNVLAKELPIETLNKFEKITNSPIPESISGSISKRYQELKKNLIKLEAEIIDKESVYKESSKTMRTLKRKRDNLKNALSKPKGIILKFRGLEKKASTDQGLLTMLESQLTNQKLEKAKTTLPWKLISTPTILENPVSPRISKKVAPFLLFGFFVSTTILLIKKIRTGQISDLNYLKNIINLPLIKTFSINDSNKWEESIKLIIKRDYYINNPPILLEISNQKNKEDKFSNLIKLFKDYKFEIAQKIVDDFENNEVILIIRSDNITHKMLEEFNENSNYLNCKFSGWILLK